MVAFTSSSVETTSASTSASQSVGFIASLKQFGESVVEAGKATLDHIVSEITSNIGKVARIPDAIGFWVEERKEAVCVTTAAGLAITGLTGFLARPSHAQLTIQSNQSFSFSNLPGSGADIHTASLPETMGSTRLSSGGGGPVLGPLSQRDFGVIDSPQSFTLLANQTYDIAFSGYFVGVISSTGQNFTLNNDNIEVINFSFTWKDELGKIQATPYSELTLFSSQLTIQSMSDYVWAREGVTNSNVPFQRYDFSFKVTPTQDITAQGVGVNFGASVNDTAQRVYGANFEGADADLIRRVALGSAGSQIDTPDGLGLGVTINRQNASISAPEGSSGEFALLGGGLALLMLGGRAFVGKITSAKESNT
jgi:hypothetical protein